ncbi:MAG: hypothetical protein OXH05_01645, partial [Acidobacteria bacterium]|nr:hypothetical protein [Acidobacteriota bacterium]
MPETPAKQGSSDKARSQPASAGTAVTEAVRTSVSESTNAAYERGWQRFAAYCEEIGSDPMAATPETVASFLLRMGSAPLAHDATARVADNRKFPIRDNRKLHT